MANNTEQAWQNKLTKFKTGEDVDFTPEEIDFMLEQNENLRGTKIDLPKMLQWNKLLDNLKTLNERSEHCVKLSVFEPDRNKSNAVAVLKIKSITSFLHENLDLFKETCNITDHLTMSNAENHIILGFAVFDVWSK